MKYAVIALAGRQFTVKEGDTFEVTRQTGVDAKVLFYKNGDEIAVGSPFLENVSLELEKIADSKAKKVVVARFRAKSRHRVKNGHRQPITSYRVKSIGSAKPSSKKTPKKEETE